jgi:hypothetical protein
MQVVFGDIEINQTVEVYVDAVMPVATNFI